MSLLRQIEVAVANGKTTPAACREGGITEQTYYRWRKEYGGLQVDQSRRLKELEQENAKLKRLVAELSLDKLVLKDIAPGNFSESTGIEPAASCVTGRRSNQLKQVRPAWLAHACSQQAITGRILR